VSATPDDLERSVDDAIDALRRYVAVARGVRSEFVPEQVPLDPRMEEAAVALGLALGRFEEAFESELGFAPPVEPFLDAQDELLDDDTEVDADTFNLNVEIGFEPGAAPTRMDDVVGILQQVTDDLVERLEGDGYVVSQYSVVGTSGGDFDEDFDDFGDDDLDEDSDQENER
jgi:hypothetical protein